MRSCSWAKKTGGSLALPQFGLCCKSGLIQLPAIQGFPHDLYNLFTGDSSRAKYFRKNIRKFNCGMSMCSFKANDAATTRGISCYHIHGAVYRLFGAPRNNEADPPSSL